MIITSAPGPGLCHSQRFFERFFGDSLRDSLEMDLVRSLTIISLILQWKVIQENKYNGERLQYLWKSVMNEVSSKWTEYNYVFQQIQIL